MDAFIQRAVVNALDEARGHLEQDLERALELLQTLQLDPRQDDADFGEFEGTAPDPGRGHGCRDDRRGDPTGTAPHAALCVSLTMKPDWDRDSAQLHRNLKDALDAARTSARDQDMPDIELARAWHVLIMRDLDVPDPAFVGTYRGEPGAMVNVRVGVHFGAAAGDVSAELVGFIAALNQKIAHLDRLQSRPPKAILAVCAWAHAEWVRIHPFANGNGRTARLWANWVAMRFGLPAFVRLRPRPQQAGYALAASQAMLGNWSATIPVMYALLVDYVQRHSAPS